MTLPAPLWNSSAKAYVNADRMHPGSLLGDVFRTDSALEPPLGVNVLLRSMTLGDSESKQESGLVDTDWLPHPAFQIRRILADVVQRVRSRTISPPSDELRLLARQALDRIERERNIDVEEWADRIAREAASADD